MLALQLEDIALDPHAEDGKGSIGSTQALNLDFTQPQATQGMSAPKVRLPVVPMNHMHLGGSLCIRHPHLLFPHTAATRAW